MKKLLLLLFLASPLLADDEPVPDPVNFGINDLSAGMYSYPDANKIPDNAANLIQNFYTDIQSIAIERQGSVLSDSTVLGNPNAVSALWSFVDTDGNEWLIAFSSHTYYKKSSTSSSFTSFGPVTTSSFTPTATINLGQIWFEDGKDILWSFNGTTTSSYSSAPIGTLISSWRNRLAVAGSTSALSTIYFSEDGDGSNWIIGAGDSDPFTIQVGGANDGYGVNCLYGMYQDTLIIGRKFDTWGTFGFAQSDEQTRKISSEVGCIENRTMKESDGDLIWLSARGIEKMNGSTIQLISDPIRDLTDTLAKNTVNIPNTSSSHSNIQQTAADWGAGTSTTFIDTTTSPGNVQLVFPDTFTNLRNGTLGTKKVWNTSGNNGTTGVFALGGVMSFHAPVSSEAWSGTAIPLGYLNTGMSYFFSIQQFDVNPSALFHVIVATTLITSGSPLTISNALDIVFVSTESNFALDPLMHVLAILQNGTTIDATVGDEFLAPKNVSLILDATNYSLSMSGVSTKTGAHNIGNLNAYVYFDLVETSSAAAVVDIGPFDILPETGTFTSQLITVGNTITSWGPFTASVDMTGPCSGDGAFFAFGSTNVASVVAISSFSSLSSGNTPAVPTNPYAAIQVLFNRQVCSPIQITLHSLITQWNTPTFFLTNAYTWDRRYWLSFSTVPANNPDTILLYQRNKTWSLFKGIHAGSLVRWKDNLYFGDSTGVGLVYRFDDGAGGSFTDNGTAINAVIRTKSYDGGFPYRNKAFRKMFTGFMGGSGLTGTLNLYYDIDRSGASYTLGSANLNEYNGSTNIKFPFNLSTNQPDEGREIQYTLVKNDSGNPLHLYEFRTMYFVKEPR